ncbi:MAG: hypothetical protein CM1200mP2_01020 [Planctomycetaceae bacterium]|nr:MAG: hypothetical protein CM1200mP2_01020 [Planctomycetaceae bacterium]
MNAPVPLSPPTPPVAEAGPPTAQSVLSHHDLGPGGLFVITILAMIASALGPKVVVVDQGRFRREPGWFWLLR